MNDPATSMINLNAYPPISSTAKRVHNVKNLQRRKQGENLQTASVNISAITKKNNSDECFQTKFQLPEPYCSHAYT